MSVVYLSLIFVTQSRPNCKLNRSKTATTSNTMYMQRYQQFNSVWKQTACVIGFKLECDWIQFGIFMAGFLYLYNVNYWDFLFVIFVLQLFVTLKRAEVHFSHFRFDLHTACGFFSSSEDYWCFCYSSSAGQVESCRVTLNL